MSESQLLIINLLVYLDQFYNTDLFPNNEGRTVEEILNDIKASGKSFKGICNMSAEEWERVINEALNDEQIKKMILQDMYYNGDTGGGMACFTDEDGQAYAFFKGTGNNEWGYDVRAGIETDSFIQIEALKWLESLEYENIIVSGHSTGGNKAMYVAILSDKVLSCVAFDGQGFSKEFLQKYADLIAERASKITLISHVKDFVNILLYRIPGIKIQYVNNDNGISDIGDYHSPFSLFSFRYENGIVEWTIGPLVDENNPVMQMLHDFIIFFLDNASEAEKIVLLNVLGELLEQYFGGNDAVVRTEIIDLFGYEAADIFIRYLSKYLRDLRINDQTKFSDYIKALKDMLNSEIKGEFWDSIFSEILLNVGTDLIVAHLIDGDIPSFVSTKVSAMGKGVIGRDFSIVTRNRLIAITKELGDEPFWDITKWDIWYGKDLFRKINPDNYAGRINEYFKKVIDINNASVEEIRKIFEHVRNLDISYSNKVKTYRVNLSNLVSKKLKELSMSISV